MNIRKTLFLILIMTIAVIGLTLTGCEKSDHTHEHPEAKTCCGDDPSKCCGSKAVEEAEEAVEEATDEAKKAVEGAAAELPTGESPQ